MSNDFRSCSPLLYIIVAAICSACNYILPYPETGGKDCMMLEGTLVHNGASQIKITRLYALDGNSFLKGQEGKEARHSDLTVTVNGKDIDIERMEVQDSNLFDIDYAFLPGDVVRVAASSDGLEDASAEIIIPEDAKLSVSATDAVWTDDKTIKVSLKINDASENTGAYALKAECSQKITTYNSIGKVSEEWVTHSTGLYPGDTGVLSYLQWGIASAKNIGSNKDFIGEIYARQSEYEADYDSTILTHVPSETKVRVSVCHLSEEAFFWYLYSSSQGQGTEYGISTISAYTNISNGYGYIGGASKYVSDWINVR